MNSFEQEPISMLEDIHTHFLNSVKVFRELVCLECDWSEPTFYRKLAATKHTAISNAEKRSIIEKAEYMVNRITDCINQHKQQ